MTESRSASLRWLPVVGCAALITVFSGPIFSFGHFIDLVGQILGRPDVPPTQTVVMAITVLRKSAHVLEYAALALLLARALAAHAPPERSPLSPARTLAVLLAIAAFASLDELRQTSVPGRLGQVSDVLIDLSGGVAALALLQVLAHRRRSGCRP